MERFPGYLFYEAGLCTFDNFFYFFEVIDSVCFHNSRETFILND